MATKEQIKRIYALGAVCDLLEQGNKRDNLHAFVFQLTAKLSISQLTDAEAKRVISHLEQCRRAIYPPQEPKAWISKQQISLAFRLVYRLAELDETPSAATPKERLCGVMSKVLNVQPDITKDIFKGVTEEQGAHIIETLKRYVRTAERRAERRKNGSSQCNRT